VPGIPTRVPARVYLFVALAVLLAAVFVRLGFWQLDRLQQRRARNDAVTRRLAGSPVRVQDITDTVSFQRAIVAGHPDLEHEIVYAGRSHNGSPGVYILTPIRFSADSGRAAPASNAAAAALVLRGWVYSPDAATVDLSRWREERGAYAGYTLALQHLPSAGTANGRTVRSLDRKTIQGLIPYQLAPVILVAEDSGGATVPVRIPLPALDDGPHLSYAIQWFSFAAIALVGAFVVFRKARRGLTDA